jgi:N-acetylglucosaminyldiphosphoundecaprenol N-acetyl-beta-D-mannosaminyltransferase
MVLEAMDVAIRDGQSGHYISITNTESMYHGLRMQSHAEHIKNADFSLCDGVGVIVAGWAWGHRIARFNGPILQLEASQFGQGRKWRHFFYGGKEGVAEEMAKRLTERFPDLVVCGSYCPPFKELGAEEDQAIVDMINAARPDIVWVGLGLVKQEQWIQKHLGRVRAAWMIGVGAAFDYHAGTVPWAPTILRMMGLEWLFRLIIQPRLRAKRYWWSFVFVVEATLKGLFTFRFLRRPKIIR